MSEKKELVAVCLSWAFLAALIVWDSRKNTKETQRAAKGGENHSGKRLPKSVVVSRFPEIEHPPEAPDSAKQWRQAERQADYAKQTVIVTACALGVSIVGGVFAYAAFHEASIQADAAVQANRAWVEVDISFDHPFEFRVEGLWYPVTLKVKNIGHSPAVLVKGSVEFYIELPGILPPRQELKRFCDEAKNVYRPFTTLFPNNDFAPINWWGGAYPQKLIDASNNWLATAMRKPVTKVHGLETSYIVACITYSTQGFDSPRQTRIIREITGSKSRDWDNGTQLPNIGTIPASEIHTVPSADDGDEAN